MGYPFGIPSSGVSNIFTGNSFTPSSMAVTVRDNLTSVDKASLVNSLGTQISYLQNFVNLKYLGRFDYPIENAYFTNVEISGLSGSDPRRTWLGINGVSVSGNVGANKYQSDHTYSYFTVRKFGPPDQYSTLTHNSLTLGRTSSFSLSRAVEDTLLAENVGELKLSAAEGIYFISPTTFSGTLFISGNLGSVSNMIPNGYIASLTSTTGYIATAQIGNIYKYPNSTQIFTIKDNYYNSNITFSGVAPSIGTLTLYSAAVNLTGSIINVNSTSNINLKAPSYVRVTGSDLQVETGKLAVGTYSPESEVHVHRVWATSKTCEYRASVSDYKCSYGVNARDDEGHPAEVQFHNFMGGGSRTTFWGWDSNLWAPGDGDFKKVMSITSSGQLLLGIDSFTDWPISGGYVETFDLTIGPFVMLPNGDHAPGNWPSTIALISSDGWGDFGSGYGYLYLTKITQEPDGSFNITTTGSNEPHGDLNLKTDNTLRMQISGSGDFFYGQAAGRSCRWNGAPLIFRLIGLPTSAAGLPTGALYNSSGTVKIA